ncbi:MAG: class I SAM-dependent methyltransferase [Candidatus Dormibacteria bacterium]
MSDEHYFSSEPRVASRRVNVRVVLPDRKMDFQTDRGVFAHGRLDRGTELLLRSVQPPQRGALLDLGCGYGAIAVTMALRAPAATIWAIDVNARARELTAENARLERATNVHVGTPNDVPDLLQFDAVYSNPPVRLGKAQLHDVVLTWLRRLRPDGVAYLVVQRHLGSDTLARWLIDQGLAVSRVRSRQAYRLLEVRPATGDAHHGA